MSVALFARTQCAFTVADAALLRATLGHIVNTLENMALDISKMKAAVEKTAGVEASAIAAFNGISGQLKDISAQLAESQKNNDPAAAKAAQDGIDGLAASLDTNASALADAVAANSVGPADQPLA